MAVLAVLVPLRLMMVMSPEHTASLMSELSRHKDGELFHQDVALVGFSWGAVGRVRGGKALFDDGEQA